MSFLRERRLHGRRSNHPLNLARHPAFIAGKLAEEASVGLRTEQAEQGLKPGIVEETVGDGEVVVFLARFQEP